MKTEISEYQQQALDFLAKTNTAFTAEFLKHSKYFDSDTQTRDIYKITLQRAGRKYSFNFGQSINASGQIQLVEHLRNKAIATELVKKFGSNYAFDLTKKKLILVSTSLKDTELPINPNYSFPTEYDVLACLTKYDPGTFQDFCDNFGYDVDSRSAEKTYNAVKEEYNSLCTIFSEEEMQLMAEIQ